ncbi:sodium-independent sulfate anion transporter isoform X2 [Cimex lectularius]|uniref:STAS domain-containing protein n=1 Tax=Cimex lectularius TaxID=79782 RepID=A0A8I6S837_CIMLE|nr:sodium-independent sulfate anion transporter isoform X2 [Cimex lectularius]
MGHATFNKTNTQVVDVNGDKKKDDVIEVDDGYDSSFKFKFNMAECCQKDHLQKRLPILNWLPKYSLDFLLKDFIAGLTVGLTAIPQGIAYAVVAGLQPQYGLYSGFMGCFVYMILGSCKDITIGPTAIMALMTQKYVESHGADFAILMAFLSGAVIFVLGLLRLGFLVEFISMPVTVGFTSAAAMTIASSQIKGLLGLPGKTHSFVDAWINVYEHITELRIWDTLLGVCTIIILVLCKKLKEVSETWNGDTPLKHGIKKAAWLLGLARNAVVVIVGTLLAYVISLYGLQPFLLTGTVGSGLPPFRLPPFSTKSGNETLGFIDMTKEMGSAIVVVPLIAILESIAIAKAFAKGKTIDATQEMIALGMCNIAGSFFSSFPTTGSFTRTAVNHASGVVTPFGGVFTGALVLLSLSFLTSTFYFIPKATLSGVIVCAMFYMVEYHAVTMLWRTKKLDLVPLACTLLSCLFFGLEYGMLVGITVNLLFILYQSARPSVALQWLWVSEVEVLLVTPTQSLVFPASDYIREVILQSCVARRSSAKVVIDGTHIHYIDSTMAKGLKMIVEDLRARGQEAVFWRWKESAMFTVLGFDPDLATYFRFEDSLVQLIRGPTRESGDGQGDYEKLPTAEDDSMPKA